MAKMVTVETEVLAAPARVWQYYTDPAHVVGWNFAHPSWHCPAATADLCVGGEYRFTMAAKDGSASFDFGGVYTLVEPTSKLFSTLGDGRFVEVLFKETIAGTQVSVSFELEGSNSEEAQLSGWGAILDEFKRYCEARPR